MDSEFWCTFMIPIQSYLSSNPTSWFPSIHDSVIAASSCICLPTHHQLCVMFCKRTYLRLEEAQVLSFLETEFLCAIVKSITRSFLSPSLIMYVLICISTEFAWEMLRKIFNLMENSNQVFHKSSSQYLYQSDDIISPLAMGLTDEIRFSNPQLTHFIRNK